MKVLFLGTVVVVLLIVGTQHLLFPRRLQEDELRDLTGMRARLPFIRRYVGSRQYLLQLRLFGLVCYVMAAVLMLGLLKHERLPIRW